MTARVLHLNGAPGVGKSTLARRWADEHPGTLVVEADALRTWVSGWRDDWVAVGSRVRPVTLAMISAYAGAGHDVVVPQLVGLPGELELFRTAATDVGATYVQVLVRGDAQARFAARALDQPWLQEVRRVVDAEGPGLHDEVERRLSAMDPRGRIELETTTGDLDGSYRSLVAAVVGDKKGGTPL